MSKRQVLRDYQSYLADRLKQVEATSSIAAWLGVGVDGQKYLLPLADTAEIVGAVPIQPIAHVKPWLRGVANWRGTVVTVVDWGLWMAAQPGGVMSAPAQVPERRWMVSLKPSFDLPCLLAVDETFGLKSLPRWQGPVPTATDKNFTTTQQDADGVTWTAVNLQALARLPTFLNISLVTGSD